MGGDANRAAPRASIDLDYACGTEREKGRDAAVPPPLNVVTWTNCGELNAVAHVTPLGFEELAPPHGAATIWPAVSPLSVARMGRPATVEPKLTTTVLPVDEATVTPLLPPARVPVASTRAKRVIANDASSTCAPVTVLGARSS